MVRTSMVEELVIRSVVDDLVKLTNQHPGHGGRTTAFGVGCYSKRTCELAHDSCVIRKSEFARYLEEATIENDLISIGSFSISMPLRQCVSESSLVGIDWPASSRCDAQLP